LRLWTADERIPQLAQVGQGVFGDFLWYVRQAIEQLDNERVPLFAYLPPSVVLSDVAGSGSGRLKRPRIRRAQSIGPNAGKVRLRNDELNEGAEVHLPLLSALTADPSYVWDLSQRSRGGIVFKIHAHSARPTWWASISPEEREYTLGHNGSVKLVIRSIRIGVTGLDFFRGIDFASRTFGSSQLLNRPFGVPDGMSSLDDALEMHKVVFVEAEEVSDSSTTQASAAAGLGA